MGRIRRSIAPRSCRERTSGPALAELRLTGDCVELVRTLPIRGTSGHAISGLPGPGSAHAVTEPALDLTGGLLPPDPSGATPRGRRARRRRLHRRRRIWPIIVAARPRRNDLERWVPPGPRRISRARPTSCGSASAHRGGATAQSGFRGVRAVARRQAPAYRLSESARASRPTRAPPARHARIWRLDAATGAVEAQYLYPFNPPPNASSAMMGQSGATSRSAKWSRWPTTGCWCSSSSRRPPE